MGQGIGQMVLTEICHVTELDPALFVFEAADTARTPDSGTSTASRQTVMTGEAARRVGEKLKMALSGGKTIADLEGQEFFGEYSAKTDPLGAIKENPISHVSYSYGAQVIILNEQGRIEKAVSAFDVGTPVNVQSVEGRLKAAWSWASATVSQRNSSVWTATPRVSSVRLASCEQQKHPSWKSFFVSRMKR